MSKNSPPPTTRDALLRAARDELAEKGHAAVSMRAVARRAGVSHAAPAHFFGDRAGMLTAVATDGFHLLAQALSSGPVGSSGDGEASLASLGRAYVDFGMAHPALFDLMFRRTELTPDDADLVAAQAESLGQLRQTVADVVSDGPEGWSLLSWAVVHGLVTLIREGVLAPIAGSRPDEVADLARDLVDQYAAGIAALDTVK